VYVGLGATGKSLYERTTDVASGTKEYVHFIYAGGAHGGNAFALHVVTDDGAASTRYNHFDHLGSVTATSDENGRILGPAWGGADATVFSYDAIVVPEACRDLTGCVPGFHGNTVRACLRGLAGDWRDVKTAVWIGGWQLPLTRSHPDWATYT